LAGAIQEKKHEKGDEKKRKNEKKKEEIRKITGEKANLKRPKKLSLKKCMRGVKLRISMEKEKYHLDREGECGFWTDI
jgi:hypothetical protein